MGHDAAHVVLRSATVADCVGHTGFSGTSLWIDWERDLYIVLLTNRVHPTRENNQIRAIRPAFHDAVVDAVS